jgi:hypothetical protein
MRTVRRETPETVNLRPSWVHPIAVRWHHPVRAATGGETRCPPLTAPLSLLGHVVDLYALPDALLAMGALLVVASFVFAALYRAERHPAQAGP